MAAFVLLLWPALLLADVILFKDGTRLEGKVVHENADSVTVLFVRDGNEATVTYPRNRIDRIIPEDKTSHERLVDEYHQRAAAVGTGDVRGWWELATWAGERNLIKEREDALHRLLELDPNHEQARTALGFVRYDGQWVTRGEAERGEAEARRAKLEAERQRKRDEGYVEWDGQWYKPEELTALAAMKEAESIAELSTRLDAIQQRLDRLDALDADHIEARFDRLERGLTSLADGLTGEFRQTRESVTAESERVCSRINELTVIVENLRQEVQALRQQTGRR